MRALFAVLALVGQLAVGSLVLPDRTDAASLSHLDATIVLCRSSPSGHAIEGRGNPTHRHHPLQVARSLDLVLELPSVILPPASHLPPPSLAVGGASLKLPPARAPPLTAAWAWRARGPPVLA